MSKLKYILGFLIAVTIFLTGIVAYNSMRTSNLNGRWQEVALIQCEDESKIVPTELIGELEFKRRNNFSVTWHPFELYKDYWGTYQLNRDQTIVFEILRGNQIPEEFDGNGSLMIVSEKELILKNIWLGERDGASQASICGHVFEKYP